VANETPPPPSSQKIGLRFLRRIRTFDSLAIPAYRNYFGAMFLFFGAMQMTQLARPWIAFVLSENDAGERSFFFLGITVAANHVPSLLLSPYAGALADRFSKRTILQIAAVAMAFFALLTAVGLSNGLLEWWHVALLGIAQGAVMTFITPTRRAIIPELVDREHILNATALHTVELNINRTTMLAISGFLIDAAGAEWAYFTIAAMYLVSTLALLTVPISAESIAARRSAMSGAVSEGFRYAMKEPTIRVLLLIGFVGAVFGQPIQHLLVLFADVLDVGASEIGLLGTMMGIGALLGSTFAASLGDFKRKGLLLILFFTLLGISIVAFSASSIYILSLVLMFPVGLGHSGRTSIHLATLQTYVAPEMRGRVMALNAMQGGFQPISILAISAVAELANPQIAMGISGSVIVLYGLWELIFSRTVRNLE
jgi:MFS family permease